MKLLEIKLLNFRQFAGEQRFELATSDDRNVTLVFGANGSGKTTLLNAFTWALYGTLSGDLENKHRLVTDVVWRSTEFGRAVTAAVDVTFEHDEVSYRVRREVSTTKSSDEQRLPDPQLKVWATPANGATTEVSAGQQKIDSILPEQLSRFFFFNGERIEHLVSKSAYAEVKQAIKTLLGLEQVERALEHLPKVERRLGTELRKVGGEKAGDIAGQIEEARDEQSRLAKRLEHLEAENSTMQDERSAVSELLQRHHVAGPLQDQRSTVERELDDRRAALRTQHDRRRKLVAEQGFIAFTAELAAKTAEVADSLKQKGELPAPLKREFVDNLLEQSRCICGTQLVPGTDAHQEVTGWRARAGLAEVESAWQRLSGEVGLLQDARARLRQQLEESLEEIVDTHRRVRQLEEDKTRLDAEIKKLPREDVQGLESKRQDLNTRIDRNNRDLGATRSDLDTVTARIESLRGDLKRAEITDELAAKARKRVETVQEVHSALQRILEIRTETVRNDLDQRIKDVFRRITVKPYVPELTADFELGLFQEIDGERHPVAKSTGENQILSLSFVAAVSQLASEYRKRQTSETSLYDEGGAFPIVMDAAFGSLDENYQRDVSRALPVMAPQMLVCVSKSQGLGVVMEELEPRIGRLGVVVAYTTNAERDHEDIVIRGHSNPYVRTRAERDWAELIEVK